MTTTRNAGFDVAGTPPAELAEMLALLQSKLNPIDHMDCAALLMATCDLRTREALALQWRDADLKALTLEVARSCDELGNPAPAKVLRTIAMPEATAEGLRRRRTVQTAYFKRYARALVTHDSGAAAVVPKAPIVSTPEGRPVRPKMFSRWWHDRRADFGMCGWTLNDLRKARIIVESLHAEAGR